jgi:hypothetical protein
VWIQRSVSTEAMTVTVPIDSCEETALKPLGALGFPILLRYRKRSLGCMSLLLFLALVLVCVGYGGTSLIGAAVISSAWTIETNHGQTSSTNSTDKGPQTTALDDTIAYFGLASAFFPSQNISTASNSTTDHYDVSSGVSIKYESCNDDDFFYGTSTCSDCYHAGKKVGAACGLGIFFAIVLFVLSVTRIYVDRAIFKATLLVFGFMNFITLACAIGIWINGCKSSLHVSSSDYILSAGPGLSSVVTAFVFNIIALFVNLFTVTKDYYGHLSDASGEHDGTAVNPLAADLGVDPNSKDPAYKKAGMMEEGNSKEEDDDDRL